MDNVEALVELAALKVAEDMVCRPVMGADSIWRFDRVIEDVFGRNRSCTKEFWRGSRGRCPRKEHQT